MWRFEILRAARRQRPWWQTSISHDSKEAVEDHMEWVLRGWEDVPLSKRPKLRLVSPDGEITWQNFEETTRNGKTRFKIVR